MKMQFTLKDLEKLRGHFLLQVNGNDLDYKITPQNWDFVKEKRLGFLCTGFMGDGYLLAGFYYAQKDLCSAEEMLEYLNKYNKLEEDVRNRYHRLLTSEELEFVFNKIKESNL